MEGEDRKIERRAINPGRRRSDMDKQYCDAHSITCERIAKMEAEYSASRFVTYKWLIGTIITLAGAIVAVIFSLQANISKVDKEKVDAASLQYELKKLDYEKVDLTIFNALCVRLDKLTNLVEKNDEILRTLEKNQVKYMERFGITPVERKKDKK